MKLDLTSVKKFEAYLAKIGLENYGADQVRQDIETASKMDLFDNKMQKIRILNRLKELESNK